MNTTSIKVFLLTKVKPYAWHLVSAAVGAAVSAGLTYVAANPVSKDPLVAAIIGAVAGLIAKNVHSTVTNPTPPSTPPGPPPLLPV